jgi:outer membrane protein OmpA-like peptidoglycan-associated protein
MKIRLALMAGAVVPALALFAAAVAAPSLLPDRAFAQVPQDKDDKDKKAPAKKPPPKPDLKPAEKPTPPGKPPIKPAEKPVPPGKPDIKPAEKPTPPAKPTIKPVEKPLPPGKPEIKPAEKPTPTGKPTIKPAEKPLPTGKPEIKPAEKPTPPGKPPIKPAEMPTTPGKPGIKPAQKPAVTTIDQARKMRREIKTGEATVIREPGGRTIVRDSGRLVIQRNDSDWLRRSARNARTERRGNEIVTIIDRGGGVQIINVTDDNGRLLRRIRRERGGREVVLIDNRRRTDTGAIIAGTAAAIAGLVILNMAQPRLRIPRERYIVELEDAEPDLIYETLAAAPVEDLERAYSLDEIRFNEPLRARMRRIDIDTITFDTGSWEVSPDQYPRLEVIARAILRLIERNENEVVLLEGHADAVGNEVDNLSLSDRRAEAVAQILIEQFGVPAENLTTQGYGEQHLKIPTDGPERRNRRVTVRRITPLLNGPVAAR